MIQHRSMLSVADNSGAQKVMCIRVHGGYRRRYARLGDIITCVVKMAMPHTQMKKGDIVYGLIVRTKKETRRPDGTYIRFDDNAVVIIDKKTKDPLATRIFGPIAREIKDKGFSKIASLASEVV